MNLTEYRNQTYMNCGKHNCKIVGYEESFLNSTGEAVARYTFINENEEIYETNFLLRENTLWKLADLATKAGLTEAEMKKFDFEDLVGRYVDLDIYEKTVNDKIYKEARVSKFSGKKFEVEYKRKKSEYCPF